jgi:hypothetical protein
MVSQLHQRTAALGFMRVVVLFFLVRVVRMLVVVLVFFMLCMFFVLIFHGLGGGGGLRARAEESKQGKGGNAVTQDQQVHGVHPFGWAIDSSTSPDTL